MSRLTNRLTAVMEVLNYHVPCVLRARHHPRGGRGCLSTLRFRIVRDIEHKKRSQTLQIGVFARGSGLAL